MQKYLDNDAQTANEERRRQCQEHAEQPEVVIHGSGRRTVHNQVIILVREIMTKI